RAGAGRGGAGFSIHNAVSAAKMERRKHSQNLRRRGGDFPGPGYFGIVCMKNKLMREAIRLSIRMMREGKGGPFGAVVVRNGKIVGRGCNQVTSTNDPTAHAEVVAIRDACRRLKTFQLDDCELYTSCEPCPMCLSAMYWARLKRVYYANTRK